MKIGSNPRHSRCWKCVSGVLFLELLFLGLACSPSVRRTLVCDDTREASRDQEPWILWIDEAQQTADMVVHVPAESIKQGTPAGNRRGSVLTSERAYEVTIPSDSGGQGEQRWVRLQFRFRIDRYTGAGTLTIGEKQHGEVLQTPIRCDPGPAVPRF